MRLCLFNTKNNVRPNTETVLNQTILYSFQQLGLGINPEFLEGEYGADGV